MIRKCLKAAIVAAVLGGVFLSVRALAQTGLEFYPLAFGYSPERQVHVQLRGPIEATTGKMVLQPLGDIGWHTHPGVAIAIVTKGALTEYHSNGCVSVHQAGSVFIEQPGEVHRVVNHSATEAVEAYLTFLLPAGSQPLQPAAEPRPRTCSPGQPAH